MLFLGKESNFQGVVDIIRDRAIYFEGTCGNDLRYDSVPTDLRAQTKDTYHELVENLVTFSKY
jgi:elongation factor G